MKKKLLTLPLLTLLTTGCIGNDFEVFITSMPPVYQMHIEEQLFKHHMSYDMTKGKQANCQYVHFYEHASVYMHDDDPEPSIHVYEYLAYTTDLDTYFYFPSSDSECPWTFYKYDEENHTWAGMSSYSLTSFKGDFVDLVNYQFLWPNGQKFYKKDFISETEDYWEYYYLKESTYDDIIRISKDDYHIGIYRKNYNYKTSTLEYEMTVTSRIYNQNGFNLTIHHLGEFEGINHTNTSV